MQLEFNCVQIYNFISDRKNLLPFNTKAMESQLSELGNRHSFIIRKLVRHNDITMAKPDTMIIYLNQIIPSHMIYIPPNVKIKETNGSKSKKVVSFGETLVIYNKTAKTKKISESDRIWL